MHCKVLKEEKEINPVKAVSQLLWDQAMQGQSEGQRGGHLHLKLLQFTAHTSVIVTAVSLSQHHKRPQATPEPSKNLNMSLRPFTFRKSLVSTLATKGCF